MWVYIYISAWASALLILDRRQCEGPERGISDRYRSRAFLYIAVKEFGFKEVSFILPAPWNYTKNNEPSGSGAADILKLFVI